MRSVSISRAQGLPIARIAALLSFRHLILQMLDIDCQTVLQQLVQFE